MARGEPGASPPSRLPGRMILHVDMDAFYVSVELLRRPELRGLPVVVGGTGARGVVAAASYEARRFGVHSAMPGSTARRLCPSAVFLPGDHAHYAATSEALFAVFRDVTPLVEPLSLDEAFLDVSGIRDRGDGSGLAHALREAVRDRTGLVCSVGVATNKFLAKLASEGAKPVAGPDRVRAGRGVLIVSPGDELAFLHPLPVSALWGVGPATQQRLDRLGVRTVGDLASLDESVLVAALGAAHGSHLARLSRGVDDRPVEVDRPPKSIGSEETFATDRLTHEELTTELVRLADAVGGRLRAHGTGARTAQLKVRFSTFETITRSVTLPSAVATSAAIVAALRPALAMIDPTVGVRLLGVSVSNFAPPAEQLVLEVAVDDRAPVSSTVDWEAAESTVDEIRRRFGSAAIGPASAVDQRGLRVVRRGAQQWGPDDAPPDREGPVSPPHVG